MQPKLFKAAYPKLMQILVSVSYGKQKLTSKNIDAIRLCYSAVLFQALLMKIASIYEPLNFLKVDFMIGYSSQNIHSDEQQALQKRQEDVSSGGFMP